MNHSFPSPLARWAARDLLRHPGEALLTGLCLTALTVVLAVALLLGNALAVTAERLLEASPALVVRRLDAGGWKPIPVAEAVTAAGRVPGIIGARPRIWGTAAIDGGVVTAVAVDAPMPQQTMACPVPAVGEAWLGPGVLPAVGDRPLSLHAVRSKTLVVAGRIDPSASLVAHDLVYLSPADARDLFGLGPDEASDLALEVFHPEEAEAIRADLAAAFPWPVHLTTRTEAAGRYAQTAARRSGLFVFVLVPAILALCLLVAAVGRERMSRRRETALLRVLGWTPADVVRLQLYRALALALPAVAVGALLAWLAVFWPGASWIGPWLLGWHSWPPAFALVAAGSLSRLVPVAVLVLAPFLAATLLPAVAGSVRAPLDLLTGGGRR